MATSFSGEDLKAGGSSPMNMFRQSGPHSNNAGLSEQITPETTKRDSPKTNELGTSSTEEADNSTTPQSAMVSPPILAIPRTASSIAIPTNTEKSMVRYFPTTVQSTVEDILGENPDLYAPARDSVPNLAVLPRDHPIQGLATARQTYAHSRPPFVITQQGTHQRQKEVFIAESGLRRDVPVLAQIVARDWDKRHQFWTLDMDGERIIVKGCARKRAVSVARWVYCKWSETMNAFEETPIAYSVDGIVPQSHMHSKTGENRASTSTSLGASQDMESSDENHTSDEDYTYATDASVPQPIRYLSSYKPSSSAAEARLSLDRPRRVLKQTSNVKELDPGPSRKRKIDDSLPIKAPEKRHRAPQSFSTEPNAAYDTPTPTPKHNNHRSPSPTTQSRAQQICQVPTLSDLKQNHTILYVSVTTGLLAGIIPIKLRSCMTIETFFTSVLTTACNSTEHANEKTQIIVSFDWKDATDLTRTIFLRKNSIDAFEVFLDTINEAPCWREENGRCQIFVNVTEM